MIVKIRRYYWDNSILNLVTDILNSWCPRRNTIQSRTKPARRAESIYKIGGTFYCLDPHSPVFGYCVQDMNDNSLLCEILSLENDSIWDATYSTFYSRTRLCNQTQLTYYSIKALRMRKFMHGIHFSIETTGEEKRVPSFHLFQKLAHIPASSPPNSVSIMRTFIY